jgi:hypothetical protein
VRVLPTAVNPEIVGVEVESNGSPGEMGKV